MTLQMTHLSPGTGAPARLLGAVIFLLLTACGGSTIEVDNTPDTGADEEITAIDPQLRQLSTEIQNARCQVTFGCCNTEQRLNEFGIDYSKEECEAGANSFPVEIGLSLLNEAIARGRIEVDWEAAEMCVNAFRTQSCSAFTEDDPIRTTFPGCAQMMVPQLEEGAECTLDEECITGYCQLNVLDADSPDRCAQRPQEGDDCSSNPCPSGMFCDGFENICRRTLRAGTSCYRPEECASQLCLENENGELRCADPRPYCGG
ncbi:hypothetical protein DL240_02040 [Lujinxingia litoralis]|uniref:Dickkopf N-terminal cysteine-rich domain-containing protein n=1 Tax=Lujinxingia litoralis TaxID=2211119 RepID=A0A328CBD3_9DELT|nr:hypothetical protein [Lujinxingia litoralis]RAL25016.1 hypothetical protein DL240_02040 [Lujinxingia litoralis]